MNGQNNPPTDVAPTELLLKLLERPYPSDVVNFPAKTTNGAPIAQVRVRVLPEEQLYEAKFRAIADLKKRMTDAELSSPYGEKILSDAVAKELLAVAVVMKDPIPGSEENPVYPRLFRGAADVRKLTADEITALFGAYLLVQHNYGPNAGVMDEAEVNAWVERLEAGASNLPLSQLDSHQLVDLCMFLARRSYTFSQVLSSQRQSLPISWESIPESWAFGTSSSSELAADGAHSPEDDRVITAEEAMAAAKKMIGRE